MEIKRKTKIFIKILRKATFEIKFKKKTILNLNSA